MPMPGDRQNKGNFAKMDSSDFPAFGQTSSGSGKMVYQAKKAANKSSADQDDADTADMSLAS